MNKADQLDSQYLTIAWGILFLIIGGLSLIPGDQTSWGILAAGIVFVGLNIARAIRKMPVGTASLVFGVIALGVGALILLRSTLGIPPIEVDLVPIALIGIGVYLLFTALKST